MNIILLFDRAKNKLLKTYREYVFYKKTGCRANLVGKVNLINTNLMLGKNVTIYPNVTFWGDGPISIGDNVQIGHNTIVYSSQSGG